MTKSEQRAKALVAMGLVGKESDGERWEVKTPALRGHQQSFFVNTTKPTSACTCLDYEYAEDRGFMCEHKLAVKLASTSPELQNELNRSVGQ